MKRKQKLQIAARRTGGSLSSHVELRFVIRNTRDLVLAGNL